jgi:hypothetical protein
MKRLALLLALAACGPSSPPASPGNTGGSFDERQACTADTDCVAIELECCDQCNGGNAVAVHKDYLAEIKATYEPGRACPDVACTEMYCDPPAPLCARGVCGLRFGDRTEVDPLPPPP